MKDDAHSDGAVSYRIRAAISTGPAAAGTYPPGGNQ